MKKNQTQGYMDAIRGSETFDRDYNGDILVESFENSLADWESLLDTEPEVIKIYDQILDHLRASLDPIGVKEQRRLIHEAMTLIKSYLNPGRSLR